MVLGALFIAAVQAGAAVAPAANDARQQAQQEIVVTGERVRRLLKDTASSVSVATARDIEAASASQVDEMLALVPNVQLGNGSQGPTIRGQDTTGALHDLPAFLGGNRPRTTLVVDGRRDTYSEFVFGAAPLWDVSRVEVFRSPQTTTQGQNSIAGAIFVTSNAPTFQPEARARAIIGNLRTREVSAMASGPLSPDVAVRVAGDLRYNRTASRIADHMVAAEPNHEVFGTAHAKLLVKPRGMSNSQLQLIYAHTQSQSPQVQGLTPPYRARRDLSAGYGVFRIGVDALTAAARGEVGPGMDLDLVATAGASNVRRLARRGAGQAHIRGHDWSGEAVLNWRAGEGLRGVTGVSRTHLALRQAIDLSILSGIGRFHDAQDGTGLFGEADLTLFRKATLTAGLRYQRDRQNRSGTLAASRQGTLIPLDFDRTFSAWLPKLSLAYDFTDRVRAGVLVQKAYNPGGTTLRFDTGAADNFGAERLWDCELFARATFGPVFTASANLFRYDARNAQRAEEITILAPNGFPVGFADLFNVPRARSSGMEAELSWRPAAALTARASIGLLSTRIVEAGAAAPLLQGKQFDRAPHFSASAAVDWDATDRLRLSGQVRHHSTYFSDSANSRILAIDPATIVDARGEYRLGTVTVFAYARNLFDRFALVDRDFGAAAAENPREVGIGLDARF
ncbi:iron complex outermembrane recepter protein [Sphingomonas sp. F9_3S_D5_B_2]